MCTRVSLSLFVYVCPHHVTLCGIMATQCLLILLLQCVLFNFQFDFQSHNLMRSKRCRAFISNLYWCRHVFFIFFFFTIRSLLLLFYGLWFRRYAATCEAQIPIQSFQFERIFKLNKINGNQKFSKNETNKK